jgi:photosystem II stability/assembly factor-like uncharacterized protein
MSLKNIRPIILLLVMAILVSGCTVSTNSSGEASSDQGGSVFLSTDAGGTWKAMTSMPTTNARVQTINDLNVKMMAMDPSDSRAVYLASFDRGLYYTYNIGNGWNHVSGLPAGTINDVAVDPKNKCVIYASLANRLYRSDDCSRRWTQIYFDNNEAVTVNTIAIDHYNTRNLYIGTSRGEIIKSIDSGSTWRTIQRLEEGFSRLVISPLDSRFIFAATVKNRIFSFISTTNTNAANSADLEQNFLVDDWTDMNDVLKDFDLGTNFKELVVTHYGSIFLATDKAILRSPDSGITWENIKLLPSEKDAVINALAVDKQNPDNLYYVTNTTFFGSSDGGATWSTKKLPNSRAGRELLVDFNNPRNIYMGTVKLKD